MKKLIPIRLKECIIEMDITSVEVFESGGGLDSIIKIHGPRTEVVFNAPHDKALRFAAALRERMSWISPPEA